MITDLLLILCLLTIATGVALISVPAGMIVGGALGAVACLLYERAGGPVKVPRA